MIPMRIGLGALLVLILVSSSVPNLLSADYTPNSLSATIYVDGVVGIEYNVEVDIMAVKVTIPLVSSTFSDLLVVNQNGLPLVTTQIDSSVIIDTLGASKLALTYSTQELTSKFGTFWTFNVTSPTDLVVMLPSGATIVSMSQMPLDVSTVDGRTQVMMPPGDDSISYVISTLSTKEHAKLVIMNAQESISTIKVKGVLTAEADELLARANTAFNMGDYLKAEQLATQAKSSAHDVDLQALAANIAIQRASTAIQMAKNEGRNSNIAAADILLVNAQSSLIAGDYAKTKISADQAYDAAFNSKSVTDNSFLIGAASVALLVLTAGVILYMRSVRKVPPPQPLPKKSNDALVELDMIFQKNPGLRVDDKEVLRFLSEHGGEAFANEIRDRFGIPRTSAWRMIRRLMDAGIVEERKIGGQSLIYIVKKYRKANDE